MKGTRQKSNKIYKSKINYWHNMLPNREILIKQLQKNSAFWSYGLQEDGSVWVPDELLIEKTLLHGDLEQLCLLFHIFPVEKVRCCWEKELVPHEKYRRINHYLGLFFFHIKDISSFLNQRVLAHPRLERLRLLAAED